MKYLIMLMVLFTTSCNETKNEFFHYPKYELDVRCGELFNGVVYELHSTAPMYRIEFQIAKTGQQIELPENLCVKITIRTFEIPKTKNSRKQIETEYSNIKL